MCTILGSLNALTVKSAVTVESLPPENDITTFSLGYSDAVSLINLVLSSTKEFKRSLLATIKVSIVSLKNS